MMLLNKMLYWGVVSHKITFIVDKSMAGQDLRKRAFLFRAVFCKLNGGDTYFLYFGGGRSEPPLFLEQADYAHA